MELRDIFIGKPVKTTEKEGLFGILRIDDITETVWCIPLNSMDNKAIELKVEQLKEV